MLPYWYFIVASVSSALNPEAPVARRIRAAMDVSPGFRRTEPRRVSGGFLA